MITTELKLPFPIYNRRGRQHRFRRNVAGKLISGLLCPNDGLLPFQFRLEGFSDLPEVAEWKLSVINCVDNAMYQNFSSSDFSEEFALGSFGSSLSILQDILTDEDDEPMEDENGDPIYDGNVSITGETYNLATKIGYLNVVEHNGGHNIYYAGSPMDLNLACGYYEMFIKLSNGDSFWSEVFRVMEFQTHEMPFLEMTWTNPKNLLKTIYQGYMNRIYLDSFISHSEPSLTEEVFKDGIDTEIVTAAKITNRYIFSEIVPEYLKTALAAAPICREIAVADPQAGLYIQCTRLRTTSNPEASGAFSFIELQFEVDDEMYRTACE